MSPGNDERRPRARDGANVETILGDRADNTILPQPPSAPLDDAPSCPDCTAAGPQLLHDSSCSLARAVDAERAADARALARPGVRRLARPLGPGERALLARAFGCRVADDAYVVVTALATGVRARSYRGVQLPGAALGMRS